MYWFAILVSIILTSTGSNALGTTKKGCRKKCNLFEVPVQLPNNCTVCHCIDGYFYKNNNLGCEPCRNCTAPEIVIKKCFGSSDTKCSQCQKGYFYSAGKCHRCTQCEYGVLSACTEYEDAECLPKPTTNTTALPTRVVIRYRPAPTNNVWFYVSVVEAIAILVIILAIMVYCCYLKPRRTLRLYRPVGAGIESTSSLFLKTVDPAILELTEDELATYIRDLPGEYACQLARLLNPDSPSNWLALAGVLGFKPNQIGCIRATNSVVPEYTQQLLFQWSSGRRATVGALLAALKKVKRDDAYRALCLFMIKQRARTKDGSVISVADEETVGVTQHRPVTSDRTTIV